MIGVTKELTGPGSRKGLALLLLLGAALLPPSASAQNGVPGSDSCSEPAWLEVPGLGSPAAELSRLAAVLGQAPLESRLLRRPADESRTRICAHPAVPRQTERLYTTLGSSVGVRVRPVQWTTQFNTSYADDRNNEALWAGRGLSTALSAGASARIGPLSIALAPVVTYQENRPFRVASILHPGHFKDIYHGHVARIDWPQRFGPDAYWKAYPGQSHARLDSRWLAAGVSTENLWWGPTQHYPIVLSNTAPGFPHAFVRTPGPVDLWGVIEVEAEAIWGRLAESDHFDADAGNNYRSVAGVVLAVRPGRIEGLWAGLARMRVTSVPAGGRDASDYVLEPFRQGETSSGQGALEVSTVFARWAMPESGFEVYTELAIPGFLTGESTESIDRARGVGFAVGAMKGFELQESWLRVYTEWMHLQNDISIRDAEPTATFYVHPEVVQGYTHRGQLLGIAVGPGSEAQILGADLYRTWGSVGFFLERLAYDDDAYYRHYARNYGMHGHDVEVSLGLRQTYRLRDFQLSSTFRLAHRRNRDFIPLGEGFWAEGNGSLVLELSWTPGS